MVMELRKRKLSEAPAPQPKRKSSKRAAKKAVEKAQNTQNKARNKARDKAQDAAPQDAPQGTSKDITQNNELDAQDTKPETATLDAQDTKPETAVVETAKDAPPGTEHKENGPAGENEASSIKSTGPIKEGETVNLVGFGGEVYTDDSKKATLRELIDESRSGVVIFTYPKASTPGCTTQACLFRDAYGTLIAAGLSVFGLSTDSPKANATFKEKQGLQYTLLCDPPATLIEAIGFKMTPKGTVRGVVVLDKKGTVIVRHAGGPAATLEAVQARLDHFK